MSHYRIIRAIQVAIVIVSLAGGGTARAEVALGASFGYTHLTYPDVPHYANDAVGIPGSEEWYQPGIRVGYLAPGGRWDLNTDVGVMHRSGTSGNDATTIELLPQIQANARGRGELDAFVNGGVGIAYDKVPISSTSSMTATRPVFGAGLGLRKSVSGGHGLLRFELRYDHLPKHVEKVSPYVTHTFLAVDMFSVKLGFDLLMAR